MMIATEVSTKNARWLPTFSTSSKIVSTPMTMDGTSGVLDLHRGDARGVRQPAGQLIEGSGQDEPLYRVGEALVLVGRGDAAGGLLDLMARVAHGDAEPGVGKHEHVVGLVADRGDLLGGDLVGPGKILGHRALVGVGIGDIAVVRLR